MLIIEEVEVILSSRNIKYYEELGYDLKNLKRRDKARKMTIPRGTTIKIKIEHLSKGSKVKIQCLCDYCLEEGKKTIINKFYYNYLKQKEMSIINKDCCDKCWSLKLKETMLLKYGNESVSRVFNEKRKQNNLVKYGVESPLQLKEIREKIKQTNIKKYGVENVYQFKEIKQKIKNILIDKYGYDTPLQVPEFKEKQAISWAKSLYKNGSSPCSRQQKYIHSLIGGELNYPVSRCMLDIAFPEEMIYVECDFSGHDLRVRMGDITKEEFKNNERSREIFLKKQKWRRIRIISQKDYLPQDDKIIEMIIFAKEYLNSGHSWIKFNIDTNIIECSQYKIEYDFGKLYKIYKDIV